MRIESRDYPDYDVLAVQQPRKLASILEGDTVLPEEELTCAAEAASKISDSKLAIHALSVLMERTTSAIVKEGALNGLRAFLFYRQGVPAQSKEIIVTMFRQASEDPDPTVSTIAKNTLARAYP